MAKNDNTSAIIDGLLKFAVTGTALSAGFVIPNALVALEKPLTKFYEHMDKRAREREARRIIRYMQSQQLISPYHHGLKITTKGQKRLAKLEFENVKVPSERQWDHVWRLVFYDIPEKYHAGRRNLSSKLKELGFYQLQQSVWVHPLPCRMVIEKICTNFGLEQYVSYIETPHIDNQAALVKHFQKRLPATSLK